MSDIAILVDSFRTKKGENINIEKLHPCRLYYLRLCGNGSSNFKIKYENPRRPKRRKQILKIMQNLGYNKTCYIRQKNGT